MEQVLLKLKLLEKRFDAIEKRVADLEKGTTTKKLKIKKKSPSKSNTKRVTIKEGSIKITKYNNGLVLIGDTYDKRDIIKKYKGWWTPKQKGWTVKLDHYSKLVKDLKNSTKHLVEEESTETLDYIDAPYNSEGSGSSKQQVSVNKVTNTSCDELDFLSDSD